MKTAVLAAAIATFLSAQAFAEETASPAPQRADAAGKQTGRIEMPGLPALPEFPLNADPCALTPYDLACDREAYDVMHKNVSKWFVDEVLAGAETPLDRVAKYTPPSPSGELSSPEPSKAPM